MVNQTFKNISNEISDSEVEYNFFFFYFLFYSFKFEDDSLIILEITEFIVIISGLM